MMVLAFVREMWIWENGLVLLTSKTYILLHDSFGFDSVSQIKKQKRKSENLIKGAI